MKVVPFYQYYVTMNTTLSYLNKFILYKLIEYGAKKVVDKPK